MRFSMTLVAGLVAAVLLLGCGGDGAPKETPEATVSGSTTGAGTGTAPPGAASATVVTTPPPLPCPYEPAVCTLAVQLGTTLTAKDWAAASALFTGANLTCPEPPTGPPAGLGAIEDEVCKGKKKGDRVRAVVNGFIQTDAVGAVLLPDVPAMLERLLGGGAVPPLYALGSEGPATCLKCRVVILGSASLNRAVLIRVVEEGGKWGATLIYRGGFTSVEGTSVFGRIYSLYQGPGKAWVPEVTAKDGGAEYEATVSAGGDCLNLRQGPSASNPVLRCLPDGSAVYVRETVTALQSGGVTWVNVVLYEGDQRISGYASKEFIKKK